MRWLDEYIEDIKSGKKQFPNKDIQQRQQQHQFGAYKLEK